MCVVFRVQQIGSVQVIDTALLMIEPDVDRGCRYYLSIQGAVAYRQIEFYNCIAIIVIQQQWDTANTRLDLKIAGSALQLMGQKNNQNENLNLETVEGNRKTSIKIWA